MKFHLPIDLGEFKLDVDEVMYYLYLPVSIRGNCYVRLPDERLKFVRLLIDKIRADVGHEDFEDWYMYLTIKRAYVGAGTTANRPGWHCDGYGSEDLNYVWYDCVPTIFTSAQMLALPEDHVKCLDTLEACHDHLEAGKVIYPSGRLLRLDSGVIHRVDTDVPNQVMRTFIKITLSKNRFNLLGNSKNPLLPDDGEFFPREVIRNDPTKAQLDHA